MCNRDKSIMLQRNKSETDVIWDLNITFKYFVCLKKIQFNSIYLNYFGQKWISKVLLEIGWIF